MSDPTLEAILNALAQEAGTRATEDFQEAAAWVGIECKSPIERVLAAALLVNKIEGIGVFRNMGKAPLPLTTLGPGMDDSASYVGAIYPQVSIGPFIADFYMEAFDRETLVRWFRMIIECDGHEFHEKTKSQVARDKRRDRWFQIRGITILRFSGSEIWHNPLKCAEDVEEAFFAAYRRHRQAD